MKIGINCLGFGESKRCGAEEVLLNIVKGFGEHNHGNEIIFFCYPNMKKKLQRIISGAEYVLFKEPRNIEKHELFSVMCIQTKRFHRIYKKYHLDAIAFINIGTGFLKYNIPILVVPHDIQAVSHPENIQNHKKYYLYKYFYKINFELAHKIVAISQTDKDEIAQFYPEYEDKLVKIFNPINVCKEEIINPCKDKTILAVNIQYPHKNTITLIKAFEILQKKGLDYKLLLVGRESEITEELEKYVKQEGLEEVIKFLGFIDRENLLQLWRKTSLYVNPSVYEGFGMTAAESLIMGAPTLLGDLAVNREVTDNLCEYYKDLKNENELARKIEEILDKAYSLEKVKQISKHIINRYHYNHISEEYWKTIHEMIRKI